jgi:hypothetical protein
MRLPMKELPVKAMGQQAIRDDLVTYYDDWPWRDREVTDPPWLACRAHERYLRPLLLELLR